MKKVLLVLVFFAFLSSVLFAETELSGSVTAEYLFDFEVEEGTAYSYGLEGTVVEFSVDFKDLSLSKKGRKKRHAEIGISVALGFDIYGGLFSWASYGFNISASDLKGAILLHTFNIVGELWGDEYVIDLLHNEVGADWAHSKLGKYAYSKYRGNPEEDIDVILHNLDFMFPKKTAYTYTNDIYTQARKYPGFTFKWRDWKVGLGFIVDKLSWGNSLDMTLGFTSPEFISADSQFNVQFALGSYLNHSDSKLYDFGGSVKGGWTTDMIKVDFASDMGYDLAFYNGKNTQSDFDADVSLSAEAWIAKLDFYFATRTPLLGYQLPNSLFSKEETEINQLVAFKYYSDAKIEFDLHKLSTLPLPVVISATGRDMFVSRDSNLRTVPYELVITGGHGLFTPYSGFAKERYGRDLDVDAKIDSFSEDSNISEIRLFGHKLLQTIEIGAGIDFKFGNLETGAEGSYDFTKKEIYGMVYVDYDTTDITAYAMAMTFMDAGSEDILGSAEVGAITGLYSETFIDLAKVGVEFRWDIYDRYSSSLSSYRDLTIYCTVEF